MEQRLRKLQPQIEELFELSSSPGLSIGVLCKGAPAFTAHYGRRRATEPTAPDDETLYNVASFTKLMTSGVVSNLVYEGLLNWDTPIRDYLPEFASRTDEVGRRATVTDLLANRTGLSAQNTFWGVMREDILPTAERIPLIACHIPAFGVFRESFIYSTWGYGLVTAVIERVTGSPFSVCVEKYIFRPLGMTSSTTNLPQSENSVFKHWVGVDGVAHEFPWSRTRGWSDSTGFGGAVAARSSTKELLVMYQSLLHSYQHQCENNVDFTTGSPFKYARRILQPHVGIGTTPPETQGYCLGTYRTQLPGNMSIASYNSKLVPQSINPNFGRKHKGRTIFHQAATFTGYNGSMYLDPESQSAVFVVVNSLPLIDVTDMVGHLLLGEMLDEPPTVDYLALAKQIRNRNIHLYDYYASELEKRRVDTLSSCSLKDYEGFYWNDARIMCYSVHADTTNQLRVCVVGSCLTTYTIQAWGGDLFCLVPKREKELSMSMWPITSIKSRLFKFNWDGNRIQSFTWHHDITPGSRPETFIRHTKETKSIACISNIPRL